MLELAMPQIRAGTPQINLSGRFKSIIFLQSVTMLQGFLSIGKCEFKEIQVDFKEEKFLHPSPHA